MNEHMRESKQESMNRHIMTAPAADHLPAARLEGGFANIRK
jgi:hypothetical protein